MTPRRQAVGTDTAAADRVGDQQPPGWGTELRSWVRAFSGAYLFGIPLLFTMEMWWLGRSMDTTRMWAFLGVAFVGSLALTHAAGFKPRRTLLPGGVDQAIETVAVGVASAALVLLVLDRLDPHDPPASIVGQIVAQALPLSLGASLANAIFRRGEGRQGTDGSRAAPRPTFARLVSDVGATAIGALFVSASVAPTEELPLLAADMDAPHAAAVVLLSLLISYGIVFASGFDQNALPPEERSIFQHPATETAIAYVVALAVAFGSLLMAQSIGLNDPVLSVVDQVVLLGLPATVGGAAGRLAV